MLHLWDHTVVNSYCYLKGKALINKLLVTIDPPQPNKQISCGINSTLHTRAHVVSLCWFAMSVTCFPGWGHLTLSKSLWGHYFGIGLHGGAAVLGSDNPWPSSPPSTDPPTEIASKEFPSMLKLSSAWQTQVDTSTALFTLYPSRKWCTDRIWHGDKYTDQSMHPRCLMDWYLPVNWNSSTSMDVSSWFSTHCVLVEEADLNYPGVCYLLCSVWPSQMVLHEQAHYPQVALELKCCYPQLLPWVCPSHPALYWSWWETNSSYAGSSCALPHPWGVPHKLVHWDRATFSQYTPYFPTYPEFCDDPWRQLNRLEPYPQPPRPLLYCICHNCVCGTWLPSLGKLWPFFEPIWHVPSFSIWIGAVIV